MKLVGHTFTVPHEEFAVIPRGDKKIVFTARAVLDFTEFDAVASRPKPPTITKPGHEPGEDLTDRSYLQAMSDWIVQRHDWTAIQSLRATEGLEWETVKANDPTTWGNWRDELRAAFFTIPEINMIYIAVQRANSLDDSYIEAARESFLLARRAPSSS